MPVKCAIVGGVLVARQKRHETMLFEIGIAGLDVVAAAKSFQWRENPEAPDPPLLGLVNAAPGVDGISSVLSEVDGEPYTTVTIRAAKATLELIEQPVPLGSDYSGFFGFKIGGVEYAGGVFILEGQANHA